MQNIKEPLIVRKDDYDTILSIVKNGQYAYGFDRHNVEELHSELKKAVLLEKDAFPRDVVRLNSSVRIQEDKTGKEMRFMVVTPDKANIREGKISVMAPIGTALIGFRQGQKVKWRVPAGSRVFTIMEVINPNGL